MSSFVQVALYALLILVLLVGVISGVYLLIMLLLRPKAPGHFVVIIPPQATQADIASLLCAARLRVGVMGDLVRSDIYALDVNLSEHTREECRALCRELSHTALVTPEELLEKWKDEH